MEVTMLSYMSEFIGTALLVLLGDGVCAAVNLEKSGFKGGGAVYIMLGWVSQLCFLPWPLAHSPVHILIPF